MFKNLILFIFTAYFSFTSLAEQIPKDLMKVNVAPVTIEGQKYIAASFINYPHWHTYWVNPGDSGLPIEAEFKIDGEKKDFDVYEWPIPKRYTEQGDIITFGYEDQYTIFYSVPNNIELKNISIHFKWLICKNICIPGEKKFHATFTEGSFQSKDNDFTLELNELQSRFSKLPRVRDIPSYFDINLVKLQDGLSLIYSINQSVDSISKENNIFSIYPLLPFSFKRESVYKDKKNQIYAKYTLDWDGQYMEPEMVLPDSGVFESPFEFKFLVNDPVTKEVYIIKKTFSSINVNSADQFSSFFKLLTPIEMNTTKSTSEDTQIENSVNSNSSLLRYILFAFLGGLILNIMPCVLPVISLKLFGLVRHGHESSKSVFKHNIIYSLGVLSTFLALALVVTFIKSTGEQVGWGFQLQSPSFVAIMIVVIFTMALNLFGLFEFRTPGGGKLGNVTIKDSFQGDFLSGVLATILSTPCSAPFLGTALTFAFTESSSTIVLIFLSIGLGMAAPFIITAFFPRLIHFLPKPGMWMVHFKNILAFSLILTTLWLLDVFLALTDSSYSLLQMNIALSFVFLAFYIRAKMTKKKIFTIILFAASFYLVYQSQIVNPNQISGGSSLINDKNKNSEITWEKWEESKMNDYIKNKQLTFIDFTAKWCMTCKVNERIVIDTQGFRDLIKTNDVKLMIGDWTKKDPQIGAWLESQGFVGVPAYFIINKNGELIKLGETITINKIKEHLN